MKSEKKLPSIRSNQSKLSSPQDSLASTPRSASKSTLKLAKSVSPVRITRLNVLKRSTLSKPQT